MGWKQVRRSIATTLWLLIKLDDEPVGPDKVMPSTPWPTDGDGRITPIARIGVRMGWYDRTDIYGSVESNGFDYIDAVISHDRAFVFVVKDGKPCTLEEEALLFPSDGLITKLRMLT